VSDTTGGQLTLYNPSSSIATTLYFFIAGVS
jgi:hypothetical protein